LEVNEGTVVNTDDHKSSLCLTWTTGGKM